MKSESIDRPPARVTEAVILMAGSGSRLRGEKTGILKPLIPIQERPLISYTIEALVAAGTRRIIAVVGFESKAMVAGISPLIPSGVEIRFVENTEWNKANGVSALAAAKLVQGPFLLTMGDHIFDQSIVDLVVNNADLTQLNLAVDRKIGAVFDLEDATKVQTDGMLITAIGKHLIAFDAIDTGLFVCPLALFDYLEQTMRGGDCSLSDGVRLMAGDGKVRAIDIGDRWWQDVDTEAMLDHAKATTKDRRLTKPLASQPPRQSDPLTSPPPLLAPD